MGDDFPAEFTVHTDCYVPTFYADESSRSGRGHGLNVQYNYDLCHEIADQFTSMAPAIFPEVILLPGGVVSFGGQLGGRYGVKTLTGYHKVVPSETRTIVPAVKNSTLEVSDLPFSSLMSKARKLATSYAYKDERSEIMYDGGRLFDRSEYFQALMNISLDEGDYSEQNPALVMVVSGQLLGEAYARAKRHEVDSGQMTSNVIGGLLSAAAGVPYQSEYTTTKPRLYMTFFFVRPEGRIDYANVAGSLACEDPKDSARLLINSAFVNSLKTLAEKGSCSGSTVETFILNN